MKPATLDEDDLDTTRKQTERVKLAGTLLAPSTSKLGAGPSDRFTLLRCAFTGVCTQSDATRLYSIREEMEKGDARRGAVKMR